MIKTATKIFIAIFITCSASAFAQVADTVKRDTTKTDTLKTDTVKKEVFKVDTNLLNKFRVEPRRNSLPVRIRPIAIRPEFMPVNMPDYEIRHWRKWFTVGINFNQASFSGNWSAGGVSNIALGTNIVYRTEYNKAPFIYTAEVNFLYGRSKNKGQSSRKTNDRLFIDNKLATKLSTNWYFFGALSFDSQVDFGYQYPDPNPPIIISKFLAPGYITESIGFEYKPNRSLDILLGTGTARQTLVLDDSVRKRNSYGVQPGKKIRNDLAFQGVLTYDKDIMQNLHLNTKYVLFIPYGRKIDYITHRLDVALLARVNKLVNVSINATSIYNRDAAEDIQFSEALAIGILYRFP
jgi:hypothetical protein